MKRSAAAAAIVASGLLVAASNSAVTATPASGSLAVATASTVPGTGLYRVALRTRRRTRLTTSQRDGVPAWSRDGKRIAFIRGPTGRSPRLFVVNSDGSGVRAVGKVTATSVSWGPGDRQLAIADGKRISVVRPDGTGLRRLYSPPEEGAVEQPAWSPDGRTILFSWAGHGIYAISPDGSGAQAVVKRPKPSAAHLYALSSPAWAPNGQRISFVQLDLLAVLTGPQIKTARLDGSLQRTVTKMASPIDPAERPTWSPDSRQIAFADKRGQQVGVFTVPSSGGKPRLLLGGSGGPIWFHPSWGPSAGK